MPESRGKITFSGILKLHKINAFYHPAVIYIQTGYDALRAAAYFIEDPVI